MPSVLLSGLLLDSPHSGTGVYSRQLVEHLPRAAPELSFHLAVRKATPDEIHVPVLRLRTPLHGLAARSRIAARFDKVLWETVALPLSAGRADILHSLYFAAPPLSPVPLIVTIHDLIPLVVPGYGRGRRSNIYSRFMARTARRSAAVITVSEHSKRDIVATLNVPAERVFVTHEAADDRFHPCRDPEEGSMVRTRYHLPARFCLYLGGAERRKNIALLLDAWMHIRKQMRALETKLVVVASFPPPDALYPDIRARAAAMGLTEDVVFLPRVAETDKPALYRAALAFLYPSTYEGFGLPPLEAMASGVPVIAADATSLPEVIGEGGLLLAPGDARAWAEAILTLAAGPRERERLAARGVERARHFHWSMTAALTVAVYRRVLGR